MNLFQLCLYPVLPLLLALNLAHAEKSPNVVIILTDDQGYHDVGFNGCKDIPTPNIDRIASEGVNFTNGYVSYPVCGPSRAGLLTGRYQGRFGYNHNPTVNPETADAGIPLEERNIAECLKPLGYRNMIVGKWHMGSHPQHHPMNRGFDEFYGFLRGGSQYLPERIKLEDFSEVKHRWAWYSMKIMRGHERVDFDEYLTDEFSQEAVRFIRDNAGGDEPFFLYLAYNAPHTPLQATEKYLKRFAHIQDENRRIYAAMVSAVDDGVGDVLLALEETGVADNTIIFFLSDNGGAHNNASDNEPLRGFKGSMWEGGLRVPFAMRWPAKIPAGIVYNEPVISLDMLATIAPYAGAAPDLERPWDGVNLVPYLTGEKTGSPHPQLFWQSDQSGTRYAVREGDIKLTLPHSDTERAMLFNLGEDIAESDDLTSANPEKAVQLKQDWDTWNAQMKPTFFPTLADDNWWRANQK